MSEEYKEPPPTHILVDIKELNAYVEQHRNELAAAWRFVTRDSPKICLDAEHMKKWGKFKAEQFYMMSDRDTEHAEYAFSEGVQLFATCLRNEFKRKQNEATELKNKLDAEARS